MGANEKKNTEIVAWYVCLIDNNDAEERLCADLPDDITQRIDEMVEAEYDVSWTEKEMTVTKALQLILKNKHVPALNYCMSYTQYALILALEGGTLYSSDGHLDWISHELKVQLLYVLNNMAHWRQCKASITTAAEIKECRTTLKKASA